MRRLVLGLAATLLALPATAQVARNPGVVSKLAGIAEMSPRQVADAVPRVRDAARSVRRGAEQIQTVALRKATLALLDDPAPTFLGQHVTYASFEYGAGGGWEGHHAYPGGLAVHTWANLRHAWLILDLYRDLYDMEVDRDLVTAAVICHDALKAWSNQFHPDWDRRTGQFFVPAPVRSGAPFGAWGSYGLMGHHNPLVAAELMHRQAPATLVFAALSHVDQSLDDRRSGGRRSTDETWERTLEDAITWLERVHPGRSAPYEKAYKEGAYRSIEAGVNFLADADWNLTQGRAAPWAGKAFGRFAARYGLKAGTPAFNMARNWAFAHADPMRLAAIAQLQGEDAAETAIETTFR